MPTDAPGQQSPTSRLLIVGAGGQAKVVIDALYRIRAYREQDGISPALVIDDDPSLWGGKVLGVSVVAGVPVDTTGYALHVAIGNNAARERKFTALSKLLSPVSVVHPHASVADSAILGVGSFVAAQTVIGPEAVLGVGCIVNHGAVVDHDCVVGTFCHIAPNATLAGNVRLGQRVLVGAGANLLPGVVIGDDCVIGAGAVVLHNIERGTTLAGVPARNIDRKNN